MRERARYVMCGYGVVSCVDRGMAEHTRHRTGHTLRARHIIENRTAGGRAHAPSPHSAVTRAVAEYKKTDRARYTRRESPGQSSTRIEDWRAARGRFKVLPCTPRLVQTLRPGRHYPGSLIEPDPDACSQLPALTCGQHHRAMPGACRAAYSTPGPKSRRMRAPVARARARDRRFSCRTRLPGSAPPRPLCTAASARSSAVA